MIGLLSSILSQFRQNTSDSYLLRVGYGGINGPLSNIRQDGSMYNGFHSFPDTLRGDYYSGDYGPNFLGVMLGSGTYVAEDADIGLVAYGGNMDVSGNRVTVQPRDAVRQRVYIAQMGLYITISAGWIEEFAFDLSHAESVQLRLVSGPARAFAAMVWVETPARGDRYTVVSGQARQERGGWMVKIEAGGVDVIVSKV